MVKCGQCKEPLNERMGLPIDDRTPCPHCGPKSRVFDADISVTATGFSEVKGKARHGEPGEIKPHLEFKAQDTVSGATGERVHHEMTIDHENDQYQEKVTTQETGEVLHECDEPRSDHQGHGNGNRKGNSNV